MNSKVWRDYLAEFPNDDFGTGDTRLSIITDLEAAEIRARTGIEAMLKFALGHAYDEKSMLEMKAEAARLIAAAEGRA